MILDRRFAFFTTLLLNKILDEPKLVTTLFFSTHKLFFYESFSQILYSKILQYRPKYF